METLSKLPITNQATARMQPHSCKSHYSCNLLLSNSGTGSDVSVDKQSSKIQSTNGGHNVLNLIPNLRYHQLPGNVFINNNLEIKHTMLRLSYCELNAGNSLSQSHRTLHHPAKAAQCQQKMFSRQHLTHVRMDPSRPSTVINNCVQQPLTSCSALQAPHSGLRKWYRNTHWSNHS